MSEAVPPGRWVGVSPGRRKRYTYTQSKSPEEDNRGVNPVQGPSSRDPQRPTAPSPRTQGLIRAHALKAGVFIQLMNFVKIKSNRDGALAA